MKRSCGVRRALAVFVVAFLGAAGDLALASDWYVETNGVDAVSGGSNSNPWASVKYAVAQAKVVDGDTIHVGAGVFTETTIDVDKNLTIQGQGMDATLLQASASLDTNQSRQIFTDMDGGVTLRGMTFRHASYAVGGSGGVVLGSDQTPGIIVDSCRFTSNHAGSGTGGIVYFGARSTATQTFKNCEFRDNSSAGEPAGIGSWCPLSISNCLFVGNRSGGNGSGAVGAYGSWGGPSPYLICDSTFISNSCAGSGGAVGYGGNYPTIRGCTFAHNSAGVDGGALVWTPDNRVAYTGDVANLTFYGNRAGNRGGAIYSSTYGGSMTLNNCTLYDNTAATNGGGLYIYYGTAILRSTIVAGNAAPSGPDCGGTISDSYALVGNNANSGLTAGQTNANGSYIGTAASPINPRLKPLAKLGGPTPVCGLYSGSVAIDHGYNPLVLATDQRGPGYPRVLGAAADIGAFEWSYVAPPVIQPDLSIVSTNMDEDVGMLDLTGLGLSATDADGTAWTWSALTAPSNGAVAVNGAGTNPVSWTSFTYTPNANFNGTNSFVVQVADDMLENDSITVRVAVAAVNDPPVCTVRPAVSGTPLVGGALNATSGDWNDAADTNVSGTASLALAYDWQYSATNDGTGVASLGDYDNQYTVGAPVVPGNYVRVQVTCTNEGVGTPAVQVVVTNSPWARIYASNAAPVIDQKPGPVPAGATEDGGAQILTGQIELSASDGDGDPLVWTNATAPAHGTVSVSGTGANPVTWAAFAYTPASNFYGTDSFVVQVADDKGGVDSITVAVDVTAVNDTPANTAAPGFTGTRTVGNTLTATNGVWHDNADTNAVYTDADFQGAAVYAYQWWRADSAGGSPSNAIAGATASAYTLVNDDKYKWIAVSVTCTDSGVPGSASNTAWSPWLKENTTPPTLVTFTNALEDGAWGSAVNWKPQDVPTPSISAVIGDVNVRSPVTALIGSGDTATAKSLRLGNNAGAIGTLEMSAGALALSTANPDECSVGYANNSTGVITQTGGAMSGGYSVTVGNGAGSSGSWTMSGSATKSQAGCLFSTVAGGQSSYGEWNLSGSAVVTGQTAGTMSFASGSGSVARVVVQDSAVYYGTGSGVNMASGRNSDSSVQVKGGRFLISNGNSSWNVATATGSVGRLVVTGGSMEFPNTYGVGLATSAGSTGSLTVAGGTCTTPALGLGPGDGRISVTNNGALYVKSLYMGYAAGSNGTMVVADNGLVTNTSAGTYGLQMGMVAGNVATLELRGGGLYSSCGQGANGIAVGYAAGSTGLVTITGGSLILASGGTTEQGTQSLGGGSNALGRVAMSGGSLTIPGYWAFGYAGRGELLLSGGTFTKNDATFYLGRASGGYGLIEVTGGTWRHGATLGIGSVVAGATGVVRVVNCAQTNIAGAVTVGGGTTVGDRYGLVTLRDATFGGTAAVTVWTNGFVELSGTGSVFRCSTFTCRGGSVTNRIRKMAGGLEIASAAGTALVATNGGRIHLVFEEDPVQSGDFWGLRWAGNTHAAALAALTNANALTWDVSGLSGSYQGVGIYTNATDTLVGVHVAKISPKGMVLMVQ